MYNVGLRYKAYWYPANSLPHGTETENQRKTKNRSTKKIRITVLDSMKAVQWSGIMTPTQCNDFDVFEQALSSALCTE